MLRISKSLLFILLVGFAACTKKQIVPPAPAYPVIDSPHISLGTPPASFLPHIDTFYGPWEEEGYPGAGYAYVYISYYKVNWLKFTSSSFGNPSDDWGTSYLYHSGSMINDSGVYTFSDRSWYGVYDEYNFQIKRDTITCTFTQPMDHHDPIYLHGTYIGYRIH